MSRVTVLGVVRSVLRGVGAARASRVGRTPVATVALGVMLVAALSVSPRSLAESGGGGASAGPMEPTASGEVASEPGGGSGASAAGGLGGGGGVVSASGYAPNLAIVTIEGEINAVTARSVARRLGQALDGGADGVVIELDTPGGEVGAVLEITSLLKASPVYTVAWVNKDAYSGGAMIALACDEIVVASGATMGKAAPIAVGFGPGGFGLQEMAETEREKALAPMSVDVLDSAAQHGHDEVLSMGFLRLGVETWAVERVSTGERYFLTANEYRALFGEDPERGTPLLGSAGVNVSGSLSGGGGSASGSADALGGGGVSDVVPAGAQEYVATNRDTVSTRPDFAREDPSGYRLVQYATDGKTLLTLKPAGLREGGFVGLSTDIDDQASLESYLGAQNVVRLEMSWSERLVSFMTQGMSGLVVRGLLIVVFLLAMFIELAVPGVGVFGVVALVALVGLVIPPMLLDTSKWWVLAAVLGGLGLLLIEAFVMPGFGLPGLAGLLLLFGGLVGSFAGTGQLFPGTGGGSDGLAWALSTVLLSVMVAGVGMYFVTRYTHSVPVLNRLMLKNPAPRGETMLEAMSPSASGESAVAVGSEGVTVTPLRPSGSAEFGGALVDVVAESGFVDSGERVRVLSATRYRVSVERLA